MYNTATFLKSMQEQQNTDISESKRKSKSLYSIIAESYAETDNDYNQIDEKTQTNQ